MKLFRCSNVLLEPERICLKRNAITFMLLIGILLFGGAYVKRISKEQALYTMNQKKATSIVVIDAGHGGADPGKVGVNDALEKEINLSIAMRLKNLLEQNDITVVMTREEDKDLASENATSRKNEDLRARVQLIANTQPIVVVSIHQNSYPEEDVDGAQVFYYANSEEGKLLGTFIQEQLKAEINDGNHRVAKANKDYYILKRSSSPAVIVECGFLSNYKEAELLATKEYQEKLAFAIHLGILQYIKTKNS